MINSANGVQKYSNLLSSTFLPYNSQDYDTLAANTRKDSSENKMTYSARDLSVTSSQLSFIDSWPI